MHIPSLLSLLKTMIALLADTETSPFLSLVAHEYSPSSSNRMSSILNIDSVKVYFFFSQIVYYKKNNKTSIHTEAIRFSRMQNQEF